MPATGAPHCETLLCGRELLHGCGGVRAVLREGRGCVRTHPRVPTRGPHGPSRPRPSDAHTAHLESDGSASRKRAVTSETVRSFRTAPILRAFDDFAVHWPPTGFRNLSN